jgi:hypothetical protein
MRRSYKMNGRRFIMVEENEKENKTPITIRINPKTAKSLKKLYHGAASKVMGNLADDFVAKMERNSAILSWILNDDFEIVQKKHHDDDDSEK